MSIEERIQQLEANSGGSDICDLLEKHFFQRNGQDPISGEPWGENDKLDYKAGENRHGP